VRDRQGIDRPADEFLVTLDQELPQLGRPVGEQAEQVAADAGGVGQVDAEPFGPVDRVTVALVIVPPFVFRRSG
jgi:hypothetical protein